MSFLQLFTSRNPEIKVAKLVSRVLSATAQLKEGLAISDISVKVLTAYEKKAKEWDGWLKEINAILEKYPAAITSDLKQNLIDEAITL